MRKGLATEIRMLREIAWFFLRNKKCVFCKKRFIPEDEAVQIKFGHRKHPPLKIRVTAHHDDEDRENNTDKNIKWAHRSCHKTHHLNDARKKVKSWDCVVFSTKRLVQRRKKKVIRAGTKRRALIIAQQKNLYVVSIRERRNGHAKKR